MNRRQFLVTSAAATAALAAPAFVGAQDPGKKYTVALIGSGWWGTNILREALASDTTRLVALCDVDQSQLARCAAEMKKVSADEPKLYEDYRELLTKEKPEIVINATPDHWHALITIDALAAGAHIYVEKPISHTINEGIAMVKAARATDRVVQVGTHRRISPHNLAGREFIRSGKLGKIGMIRAFVHYGGGPENVSPNAEVPKGLNWDMWCGPAPLRPFNRRIHAKGFRNFLDYANGTLGDWGIHWIDQIQWIMDVKAPRKVFSMGGRPIKGAVVNDATGQTTDAPDCQVASFDFGDFTVAWEHRMFAGNSAEKGETVGCYFYGTNGTFHQGWTGGSVFYPVNPKDAPVKFEPKLGQPDSQNIKELWADFMNAIQSKKLPCSDIEQIHRSTTTALLGMLSLKLGRSIEWDADKQTIVNDAEAAKLLARNYRGSWKYPV